MNLFLLYFFQLYQANHIAEPPRPGMYFLSQDTNKIGTRQTSGTHPGQACGGVDTNQTHSTRKTKTTTGLIVP